MIKLLTVGVCKDAPIKALTQEYIKRLKPMLPVQLLELPAGKGAGVVLKRQEAQSILAKIPDQSHVIALDEHGQHHTTRAWATHLDKIRTQGKSIILIIGGADGLDESVLNRADEHLALSTFTLPHMLARAVLLEQLYRAATVQQGHPYHRD